MTNLIPPSYLAAGSLTFEDSFGTTVFWRLSWGVGYFGSTSGDTTNDIDGQFGPPFPLALSTSSNKAILFQGSGTALSTNNANDYAETAGAAVFTNNSFATFTVEVLTDAPPSATVSRLRSWPNPFNPATEIVFSTAGAERMTLQIYDPRGRLVTTLLQGDVGAGTHVVKWNGTDANGRALSSGVYLVRLHGGNKLATHKLVLSK